MVRSTDRGQTFPAANDLIVGNSAASNTNAGTRVTTDAAGNAYVIFGVGSNVAGAPGVQNVTYHLKPVYRRGCMGLHQ